MKKFLGLLLIAFGVQSCDDGDLAFDSFDFSQVQARRCSNNADVLNSVFKINQNEALILQFPSAEFPFANFTKDTTIALNANRRLVYRVFDGTVTDAYFCSLLPPISPTVIDEWATGGDSQGSMKIVTKPVEGTTTLETAKYEHTISLSNLSLSSSNQSGSIIYESLNFGVFQTNSEVSFNFGTSPILNCGNERIFKILDKNPGNVANQQNVNGVLEISLPASMLPTEQQGSVSVFIDNVNVKATYKVFGGDVLPANYCSNTNLPQLYEQWTAENGTNEVNDVDDEGFFTVTRVVNNGVVSYNIILQRIEYKRVFPAASSTEFESSFVRPTDTFGAYIPQ